MQQETSWASLRAIAQRSVNCTGTLLPIGAKPPTLDDLNHELEAAAAVPPRARQHRVRHFAR